MAIDFQAVLDSMTLEDSSPRFLFLDITLSKASNIARISSSWYFSMK